MFSFEGGIVVAFLLWLAGNLNVLITINSKQERNLNKIGQRLSWLDLRPKPIEANDMNRSNLGKLFRFAAVAGIGLPFVLLSWLHVLLYVGGILYMRMKDAGAPQAVRELRWKLRNTDMTLDQIILATMKVSEQDPAIFETVRADLIRELESRGIPVAN